MDGDDSSQRRQFLTLTGVGIAGLAGCMDLGGSRSSTDDGGPEAMNSSGDRTVAMIVQPDPIALREAQRDVVTAHEEGDLNESAAQEELAQREQELIAAAITEARAQIEDAGGTHLDTVESEGTLLVEGDPATLLDLLEEPSVTAILSEQRFEQAAQREAAGETDDGGELPDDELEDEFEDEEPEDDDS